MYSGSVYTRVNKHLLWNDIIEGDGRLQREPTILGTALFCIGAFIVVSFLVILFF